MKIIILLFTITFSSLFSQNWKESTPLPAGTETRNHPITFSIGKYGYYLTGFGITENVLKDFYRFDSETEEWEQLPDFPGLERGFAYGVTYNGKAYVGFGLWFQGQDGAYLNDLWEYDPETEEWTELESCPCDGRRHPALIASNGKIFVGLGDNNINGNLNDWWEYNIESKSWKEQTNLPSLPRHHPYYFEIGDDVYVGLGHGSLRDNENKFIYKSWFKWDTNEDTWTQMKDFPGEGRVAGTQFSHGGKGYVLSGQGDDHNNFDEGEFFQYDPLNDSWQMLESHPGNSSRWAPGSFVIGDTVYFTSGRSNFDPVVEHADLWKFTLPADISSVGDFESLFEVYPNPAKDNLNLNIDVSQVNKIEISDLNGDIVSTYSNNINKINLNNLAEGAYFITLYSGSKSDTKKFVIKR